jgi:broad specificity phosphatase PhoE
MPIGWHLSGFAGCPISAAARRTRWRAVSPDAVYTSPLGRCRETGAVIAALFRLEPQPIDALADIDYGERGNRLRNDVRTKSSYGFVHRISR